MRIFPLGENALTVEFGNEISLELNQQALQLAEYFQKNRFPGFIETVPAYASTTLFYNPVTVRMAFGEFASAFDAITSLAKQAVSTPEKPTENNKTVIEIPIIIDGDSSPDLEVISKFSSLSTADVITIFLERTYTVFMLGFLPGFPYMGEVDERIACPRNDTPRVRVPRGSVGIGGKQTGIYPLESPGGWQIIGRTEMQVFDPASERPCGLTPGDEVKFVRV